MARSKAWADPRRRLGLALAQHVRDALHVGVEVEEADPPVDHEEVAALDDPVRGRGFDAGGGR